MLKKISEEHNNKLSGAAFRFALIEYCKPYTNSIDIVKKRNTLDKRYIPQIYLELHNRIFNARNQIHAHSDIAVKEAILYKHEFNGQNYSLISENSITGLEEYLNIQEITKMIQGTLDNMYAAQKDIELAIYI
ncbi:MULTISPECIES: hypothetical protein [Methylotenera]|uniref:hypothetical protein n=1 Tax=Methylotenera TaxID=359407 RepID=UPI00037DE8CD|nr:MULTISPECIES: hypothetical protein [Methylotenera]